MMYNFKISDEMSNQIQSIVKDKGFSEETILGFSKIFENFSNQESIEDRLAQRLGQYFYYYAQIDEILTKIVRSLLPELDLSIMELDSSKGQNSFLKKIELLRSLIPNSHQLKIFPLLKKLNTVRNEFAHSSPTKLNLTKMNQDLISVFRDAFVLDDNLFQKASTSIKSNDEISVTVKIILVTKMYIELFSNIETLGKKEDKHLRLFESVRKFSSLYVRRRFSILAYQIQMQSKSGHVPDDFIRADEFKSIIEEIRLSFKNLF